MIPFASDTVTLYHKRGGAWEGIVIHGCSYRRRRVRSISDGAAAVAEETTCRMPAGQAVPAAGDVIVLGVCRDKVRGEVELVRLLEAHRAEGAFRVRAVADNARPGMPVPHYAATGA